jgi:hypothetical protein
MELPCFRAIEPIPSILDRIIGSISNRTECSRWSSRASGDDGLGGLITLPTLTQHPKP